MKLLRYIKSAGLTVVEFAELCGVSRVSIYKWEKGTPIHRLRKDRVEKLIKAVYYATEARDFPPKCSPHDKEARCGEIRTTIIKHLKRAHPAS